jgi:hypothetical protein
MGYLFLGRQLQLQTCPFLLRTFVKDGAFHRFESLTAPLPKDDEVDLHTWWVEMTERSRFVGF